MVLLYLQSLGVALAGWVYMGYYPFVFDESRNAWSYSGSPVFWHQDLRTGGWYYYGTPLAQFAPENLYGESLSVYSTLENRNYLFNFSATDSIYGTASVGFSSFGFYYVYKKTGSSSGQILAYDGSQLYDYTLTFATPTTGTWDGVAINSNGVFSYYGTFAF